MIRIKSTDYTTQSIRVYTESGEEIKGIESIEINKMVVGELIYATIKVLVTELDIAVEENIVEKGYTREPEGSEFKVGDIVKCINIDGTNDLKLLTYYTVTEVDYDCMIKVDDCPYWCSPLRFELATKEELHTNEEIISIWR